MNPKEKDELREQMTRKLSEMRSGKWGAHQDKEIAQLEYLLKAIDHMEKENQIWGQKEQPDGEVESLYDDFFGDGYWEKQYKQQIVIFANKVLQSQKETWLKAFEHPQPLDAGEWLRKRQIKDEGLWETYSHENDPGYSGGGIRLSRLLSEFHQFAREKELASLTDVFKEAIYELWMYSGGEDQSSEIRKKLEKYHKITGMPWPEGELKYKPKVK